MDALEELKSKYKMAPLWARLAGAAVLGLAPGAYTFYNEGETLQNQLADSQGQEDVARKKFEEARTRKSNLPKLEEKKAFTEEQLEKAKKKLPESYRDEDVLQKTAAIARATNVTLAKFVPDKSEGCHRDPTQYFDRTISTEVEGRFAQLASFFDRIAHLDGSIFLRNIELRVLPAEQVSQRNMNTANNDARYQVNKANRDNLRVSGKFALSIYRSMNEREAAFDCGGPASVKPKPGDQPGAPAKPAAGVPPPTVKS